MRDTKLVLIEGPPGSGKTTTAMKLAEAISSSGIECQCLREWETNHPIQIGDDSDLGQVIQTSIAREESMLEQWQRFALMRQSVPLVTVMESRFWQTSVMLEYAAGRTVAGVLESNLRVINILQVLNPVLIYFAMDDPRAFTTRIMQIRDDAWQRTNTTGTWSQFIVDAFNGQKWLTDRRLSGLAGTLALFEAWVGVTEQLYERLPFPKIKIRNPHHDWAAAMREMNAFLGLVKIEL
jgi:adenylate kinase family enzyme